MSDSLRVGDLKVLTADRWRSIEPIIDAALELPAEQRGAYVRATCAGDAALLFEVEQLLAAHDAPAMDLEPPAAQRYASLLDDEHLHLPEVLGGRYKIGPVLGRGGMATVFLADDLRHERQVAVKVLNADLAAALGAELFLAEIKTTAQLHHPHILPLHDSGDADGLLYYVMPYVPRGTLRHRLSEERPLAIDEVARITTEVASALDAAHRRGVIHRDIKPENILLHDGTALVADFGIALAVSAAAAGRVARPGLILGTRKYMSPEQAAGDAAVDRRADVYSLGVVVHEMLAKHLRFDGAPGRQSAGPLPSIRELREEVPAAADAVLARALSRDPADRYSSAGALAADVRQALAQLSPIIDAEQRQAQRGPRRARQLFIVAGLLLGAGGIALLQWSRADLPRHRGSANQQALDYFHQGMAWIDNRTLAIAHAESSFKRAIAADSNFADAHAWLAQVYVYYGLGNLVDYDLGENLREARKEAERALSLDSTVAEAHVSLASVSMFYDMDWARAERELASALRLDSVSVEARTAKVALLEYRGHFGEAVKEAHEQVGLQARNEQAKLELARALFFTRQYAAATEQLTRVLERDSSRYRAHLLLGEVLAEQGKYDSAVSEMQAAVRNSKRSSRSRAYLAHVYARAGRTADAQRELDAIREKARHSVVPAFDFAIAHVGVRDMDSTFEWLNKAIDDHSMRPYVFDPSFDPIRSDRRYPELRARMHLAERP